MWLRGRPPSSCQGCSKRCIWRPETRAGIFCASKSSAQCGLWLVGACSRVSFSLGRNVSRAPLHTQTHVGLLRVSFQTAMQVNFLGSLSWGMKECLYYAKTCLCYVPCACETCSSIKHLGALQVQFPLANNVHDFVPVTAC